MVYKVLSSILLGASLVILPTSALALDYNKDTYWVCSSVLKGPKSDTGYKTRWAISEVFKIRSPGSKNYKKKNKKMKKSFEHQVNSISYDYKAGISSCYGYNDIDDAEDKYYDRIRSAKRKGNRYDVVDFDFSW
jgi:hypothetical protein